MRRDKDSLLFRKDAAGVHHDSDQEVHVAPPSPEAPLLSTDRLRIASQLEHGLAHN